MTKNWPSDLKNHRESTKPECRQSHECFFLYLLYSIFFIFFRQTSSKMHDS